MLASGAEGRIEAEHWTFSVGSPFRPRRAEPFFGYEPQWARGEFLRSGNTGTYAVEAAALMGFEDIRLLGIDLRFDLGKSHFYGQNKYNGVRIRHNRRWMRTVVAAFDALRRKLNAMGRTLINESEYDGPLDDVLPKEKSRWLKT